jgi:hypothetical protein
MRIAYAGLVLAGLLSAAPRIASYRAEIRSQRGQAFLVDIRIRTTDIWPKPSHIIDSGSANVSDVRIGGATSQMRRVGMLDKLVAAEPLREYMIHYLVQVNDMEHIRVPLAVPELPTTAAPTAVSIIVYPASDESIGGDTFPSLRLDATGGFISELSNVPNHVRFARWKTIEAAVHSQWLTPTRIGDLGVIALLVAGSFARALIRRKKEA